MPSRQAMIATATDYAQEIGWTVTEVEDTGPAVIMMLSAPGASEQMVDAPLHGLRKALKELGGPELDDGVTEEYDFETVEAGKVTATEICFPEEAETQEELDAALEMAREFPDPEAEWDAATEEEQATELHVDVAYDGLYDEEWAERDDYGAPTVKEIHRALEGDLADADGFPRPEQLLLAAEEETMQPGGLITARKEGEKDMRFGYRIHAGVKKALELAGWTFTHVVAAARGDKAVAVERSGRVTIQRIGDRLVKSAGGLLTVSKGDRSFPCKSISVKYAEQGWQIQ